MKSMNRTGVETLHFVCIHLSVICPLQKKKYMIIETSDSFNIVRYLSHYRFLDIHNNFEWIILNRCILEI